MPLKSKKSKSKRTTLRQKYKAIRKCKEHHKKLAKEAKKSKSTHAKKRALLKDPGIPKQWPFREQLIQEMQQKRLAIMAEEQRRKEEKKAARAMKRAEDEQMEEEASNAGVTVEEYQLTVQKQQEEFEAKRKAKIAGANADLDGSRRAFYKEFVKVVEYADVVIQVLDARDPLACRCSDVERFVRRMNPNKKIVLLLNKVDLVPRDNVEAWLKHLREELPTVAFKCSTQKQASNLGQRRGGGKKGKEGGWEGGSSGESLGADTLLQLLKNYARNSGLKTAVTVGVIGLPNVGKSSLINSLKRARVANVGNTPGITKSVQEIHLDKTVKLLDTPGIVFHGDDSSVASVLRNCVKVEKLADPVSPVEEVLRRCPAKQLMQLYKIAKFEGVDEFLQLIAAARGKLRKGGTTNSTAAARLVLQDWNNGVIPYFTHPPTRSSAYDSTELVDSWAREFNADAVFTQERSVVLAALPDAGDDERPFMQVETSGAAEADLMDEEEAGDMEDDDDDAPEFYGVATGKAKGGQNAMLYNEAGQFNPHAARAARKAAKKAAVAPLEEYDFAEHEWEDGGMEEVDEDDEEQDSADESDSKEGSEEEMEG